MLGLNIRMNYIELSDFESSPHRVYGISEAKEIQMTTECIVFIQKMAVQLQINKRQCLVALTIFHLYQKKFPYTEFDRYMVSTLAMFIASKVENNTRYKYFDYIEYYFNNRKGPKGKNKKFDEIKDKLKEEFVTQELQILNLCQFDFEFELNLDHLRVFFWEKYFKTVLEPKMNGDQAKIQGLKFHYWSTFKNYAEKLCLDIYMKPYALYFPGAVVAAACLFIASENFNESTQILGQHESGLELGKEILSKFGLTNFLCLDPNQDILVQNHSHWTRHCLNEEQRERGEEIDIVDVVYIARDFIDNVAKHTKTYEQLVVIQFK